MAEEAGWDGYFVWDAVWGVDPWVSLTAAAMVTERIKLGTMLTPVSRRRPWTLAGQTATLDNLSGGRVILAVGLGAIDTGFEAFGEETDRKTRAELMDEGLDIIVGLWAGQPFNYDGKHYHVKEINFYPPAPPVQKPRIPVWVVGMWPSEKSMARVARWDGLLPSMRTPEGHDYSTHDITRQMKVFIEARRAPDAAPLDIIVEGKTPGDDPAAGAEIVRPWAEVGATWWLETDWSDPGTDVVDTRIRQGPPSQP
jgi:alkanesulfonate monooxygenase SsuD/methylene tetrahydromethanopterin reductase-like flavin-dependent oxidoreductase (luciferase family)